MALVCGIDEAGRGPVIGPLVIAGALIDSADEQRLKAIGVKDSKLIPPGKRERMFEQIIDIVKDYKIIVVLPDEIDRAVNGENGLNLNWLEAVKSVEILNELKPEIAYLDCPSNNIDAYSDYVNTRLAQGSNIKVISEHKADAKYPSVSAASILAKVTRDRAVRKIQNAINVPIGSGYPADPVTQDFLRNNYNKHPWIFRKSWSSYKKYSSNEKQATLGRF